VKGTLEEIDDKATMVPERGMSQCIEPSTRFAKVMLRHGAPPAAEDILDPPDMVRLGELSIRHVDAATLPGYDHVRYKWSRKGVGSAAVSRKALVDSIRRSLDMIARAYDLNFSNIQIHPTNIEDGDPIKINLPSADIKKAEGFDLFPLMVGPTIVELGAPDATRDIEYED